jgi:Secretion system C-terminal sorting domain
MKKLTLLFSSLLFCLYFHAQVVSFDYTYSASTNSSAVTQVKCQDQGFALLSTIHNFFDYVYLTRTDVEGNLLWAISIRDTSLYFIRNAVIIETNDQGFCLSVSYRNQMQNTMNNEGAVIIRLDNSGNILWQKKLFMSNLRFFPKAIEEDSSGYFYVGLEKQTIPQGSPAKSNLLLKLNPAGDQVWARESAVTGFVLMKMELLPNNKIALGSNTINIPGAKIVVVDTSGTVLDAAFYLSDSASVSDFTDWDLHPNGIPHALFQHENGNTAALYVFDSTGTFLYGHKTDSMRPVDLIQHNNLLLGIADKSGKAVITDWSSSAINGAEIGSSPGFQPIGFFKNNDGSITSYGRTPGMNVGSFNQRLIKTLPSPFGVPSGGCTVNQVSLPVQTVTMRDSVINEVFIPVTFNESPAAFVTAPLTLSLINNCVVIGLEEAATIENTNVYPNPANDIITIKTSFTPGSIFAVYDFSGKLVLNESVQNDLQICIAPLSPGIYFWQLQQNNQTSSGRLIISAQ